MIKKLLLILFSFFLSFLDFKPSKNVKRFLKQTHSSFNIQEIIRKTKETYKANQFKFSRSVSNVVNVYTSNYNGTIKDNHSGRIYNNNNLSIYENTYALITIDLPKTRLDTKIPGEITFKVSGSFSQTSVGYTICDLDGPYDNTARVRDASISNNILSIHPCGFKPENNILKLMVFHFTPTPETEIINSSDVSFFMNDIKKGYDATNENYAFQSNEQKYDIHIPATRSHCLPMNVLIHGGSWNCGKKDYMMNFYNQYLNKDFIIVNLEYRQLNLSENYSDTLDFSNTPSLDDMLDDIHLALRDINKKHNNVVSLKRITLFGYSAGAHLALMYSNRQSSFPIKTVISLGGPVKLYKTDDYITYPSTEEFKKPDYNDTQYLSVIYSYLCKKNLTGKTFSCQEIINMSPCNTITEETNSTTNFVLYYSQNDETVLYDVQTRAISNNNMPEKNIYIIETSANIKHDEFNQLAKDTPTFEKNFGAVISNFSE